jgi:hypothetical protein
MSYNSIKGEADVLIMAGNRRIDLVQINKLLKF